MPKKSPFKLLPLQKGPTHRVVCSLCPWVANAKSQEEVFAAFEDHVFVAHPGVISEDGTVTLDAVAKESD